MSAPAIVEPRIRNRRRAGNRPGSRERRAGSTRQGGSAPVIRSSRRPPS